MASTLRPAAVAGSWYPGTAAALAREVDACLEAAGRQQAPGRLVGLVSPHAGLVYSGPVAACGYSLLRGHGPTTVVLVGPSHHAAFDGVALQGSGAWQTPLGRVPIDEEIAAALLAAAGSLVFEDAGVHRDEHSLEMQLPFLQRLLPSLRLVPLLMGGQSPDAVESLAAALGAALGAAPRARQLLLVASSDLSHYEPAAVANRRDGVVVEQLRRYDDEGLLRRLELEGNVACGGGPVVAVMKAARALGADRATVLRYADSGDAGPRDKSRVVGYVSAALTASAA
jgi:AmmeMemoRadiSam system protein B